MWFTDTTPTSEYETCSRQLMIRGGSDPATPFIIYYYTAIMTIYFYYGLEYDFYFPLSQTSETIRNYKKIYYYYNVDVYARE